MFRRNGRNTFVVPMLILFILVGLSGLFVSFRDGSTDVSAAQLQQSSGCAMVYEHIDYTGTSQEFCEGQYTDLGALNINISSLRVNDARITLYAYPGCMAPLITFESDAPNLGIYDCLADPYCPTDHTWNDAARCLKVENLGVGGNPDLLPSFEGVTSADPHTAGGTVEIKSRVKNSGDGNAGASYLGIWVSRTKEGDPIDPSLVKEVAVPSIVAGDRTDYFYESVSIPTGLADGEYYVTFEADYRSQVAESDEDNRQYSIFNVGSNQPGNDCSTYVSDVTIPDDTKMQPGQTFNKVWRLKNCGDTTWGSSYRAVRTSGSFGPSSFTIPSTAPGAEMDVGADMTAPTTAGTHESLYKIEGPNGQFGVEFYVRIVVESNPQPGNDCSTYVSDVTIPDDTKMQPGQTFNKVWRLKNCGDTTWGSSYRAVRTSGSFGPSSFTIPSTAPGAEMDVGADMTAPTSAGTHEASYKIEGPNGRFGVEFYVRIVVKTQSSDIIPPTGYYVNPPHGYRVSDDRVLLQAVVSDQGGSGIKKVEFVACFDKEKFCKSFENFIGPYGTSLDLSSFSDQDIKLGLNVYDNAGNTYYMPEEDYRIIRKDTSGFQAKYVRQSAERIKLEAGGNPAPFDVTFKNIGSVTWTKIPGQNDVALYENNEPHFDTCRGSNGKNSFRKFHFYPSIGQYGVTYPDEGTINPQENGTFSFEFSAPEDLPSGIYRIDLALHHNAGNPAGDWVGTTTSGNGCDYFARVWFEVEVYNPKIAEGLYYPMEKRFPHHKGWNPAPYYYINSWFDLKHDISCQVSDYKHPTVHYSCNWQGNGHAYDGHMGTDFFGYENETKVLSASPGTVHDWYNLCASSESWSCGGYLGNHIKIKSDVDGRILVYAHLKQDSIPQAIKRVGHRVNNGDLLGIVSMSGATSGPHLHFDVRNGESYFNAIDPFTEKLWVRDPSGGSFYHPMVYPYEKATMNFSLSSYGTAATTASLQSFNTTEAVATNQPHTTAMPVYFDASNVTDPDGKITHYTWDLGDNTQAHTATISHLYERPGTYWVTLTVQDEYGDITTSAPHPVRILDAEQLAHLTKIAEEQLATSLDQNKEITHTIPISNSGQVVFVVSWDTGNASVNVIRPSGQVITPGNVLSSVSYSQTITTARYQINSPQEGLYSVVIAGAGNEGATNINLVVSVLDITPPVEIISIQTPGNTGVSNMLTLPLSITVRDDHDFDGLQIRFSRDGNQFGEWKYWSAEQNWYWEFEENSPEQTVFVQSRDTSGNLSLPHAAFVTIDRKSPVIRLTNLTTETTSTGNITMSWVITDSESYGHSPLLVEYQLEGYDTEWHIITNTTNFVKYDGLSGGNYTFWLKVEDYAGNQAESKYQFIVEGKEPSQPLPITTAAIAGLGSGLVKTTYPFTVTAGPATASSPITYTWQATDQNTVSHKGALSDTVRFTWNTPGTKTITVTADNGYGDPVTKTHTINIIDEPSQPLPITTAAIAGSGSGLVKTTYPFTVTAGPATASSPITYTWRATDQNTVSHMGALSDNVSYTWAIAGTKTITVTVDNGYGEPVITTHTIVIREEQTMLQKLYLPLVTR
jgi:YD repeat-containing protein